MALAILYDPEVVRIAKKAGIGATLPLRLGGKLGPFSGDPIDLTATVLAVRESYRHAMPQGAVAPDPRLIQYKRVDTARLYPWSEDPLAR